MGRKHDELFKHTFKDPRRAANALRNILPAAVVAAADWSTLTVMPGSFVTKGLRHRHSDLLYRVHINGQPTYLHVLFEHQSRPDPLMPFRVVEYVVCAVREILRKNPQMRRIPPILPVVVYHGRRPWTAPTTLSGLYDIDADTLEALRPYLPEATFVLQDLVVTDDDWIRTRLSAVVALVLGSLKHSGSPQGLEDWLRGSLGLLRQVLTAHEIHTLEALIRYAFSANVTPERLQAVAAEVGAEAEETVMTVLDRLIEQGVEQGIEQGIEQGRAETARRYLDQLLGLRFGAIDDDARARIDALSVAQVEALNLRLFDPDFEPTNLDTILDDADR